MLALNLGGYLEVNGRNFSLFDPDSSLIGGALGAEDLGRIQAAVDSTRLSKDQDVLMFLGATGAGKSTTIRFLKGDTLGLNANGNIDADPAQPGPRIGHTALSETSMPEIWQGNGLTMVDLPGLFDNRSVGHEIAGNAVIVGTQQQARSVKIVLCFKFSTAETKLESLNNLSQLLAQLLPRYETHGSSILMLVSNPFRQLGRRVIELSSRDIADFLLEKRAELMASPAPHNDQLIRLLTFLTREGGRYLAPCWPLTEAGTVDIGARSRLVETISHLDPIHEKSVFQLSYSDGAKVALTQQFRTVADPGNALFAELEAKKTALEAWETTLRSHVPYMRVCEIEIYDLRESRPKIVGEIARLQNEGSALAAKCVALKENRASFVDSLVSAMTTYSVLCMGGGAGDPVDSGDVSAVTALVDNPYLAFAIGPNQCSEDFLKIQADLERCETQIQSNSSALEEITERRDHLDFKINALSEANRLREGEKCRFQNNIHECKNRISAIKRDILSLSGLELLEAYVKTTQDPYVLSDPSIGDFLQKLKDL